MITRKQAACELSESQTIYIQLKRLPIMSILGLGFLKFYLSLTVWLLVGAIQISAILKSLIHPPFWKIEKKKQHMYNKSP